MFNTKLTETTVKMLLSAFLLTNIMTVQGCTAAPVPSARELPARKESGLALDIARHFYNVDSIKKFIDVLHNANGAFLHLHLSDDQNYAIESTVLGQNTESAVRNPDGIYMNPNTGKPFLTYAQLDEIIRYAKEKNIELVPEVDSPGHMRAIFDLLTHKYGNDYVQSLKSKHNNDEIDITNAHSVELMKEIIGEVVWIFGDSSRHFHIGGDEFGYDVENNYEFINYINELSLYLSFKGLKTRVWNDGLIKSGLPHLNPDLQITYWSYDGDPQDSDDARYRRKIRASLPELINHGFQVLNYNSYYLYFNPNERKNLAHDSRFARLDIEQNWTLGLWDGQNTQSAVENPEKILGGAFTIWGENAGSIKAEAIQKETAPLIKSAINKINSAK